MARMIPATIDPNTPSPGEKDVFQRLASDRAASAWSVIHSLDLPHHVRRISGELDFVLLIPGKGILCVEVKAAASISRRDGLWYYGREPKGDPRGPFRQAAEGMHSLRERLARRYPPAASAVFWSAVVLPYTSLDFHSEEWHEWQLIDSPRYRSSSLAESCAGVLDRARSLLATKRSAGWFDPGSGSPTAEDCDRIAHVLRPDFEAFQSPRERRRQVSAELKHYTKEQFEALDAMAMNPRVVFQGPAGTGKTLLAIESARRGTADGRRVLLACFNRLLGSWLRQETESLGGSVTAGTLHSYMFGLAGIEPPPGADRRFWEEELPHLALERLLDEEGAAQFDLLLVDEAQDVLDDRYLDVLDLSVAGGLAGGEWQLFGDFERQSIYGSGAVTLEAFLERRASGVPVYSLRTNCRNTPRVASLVRLLSHLEPDYARVLRPDDGVEPELRFYPAERPPADALTRVLDELRSDGYRGRDVAVLSPRASGSSAQGVTEQPWCDRIRPFGDPSGSHTAYGTIHAFKGLEAPAIVVTDLDDVSGPAAEALFYIAVTRPTERLVLVLPDSARASMARSLAGIAAAEGGARA
ncbi:MAG: NERD domain-containing protein [Candidatus Dormibacteria bacterium]